MIWKDKNVLVTGGMGMIGQELTEKLMVLGACVTVMDIKLGEEHDCREYSNCARFIEHYRPDFIFHLAGIKGNIWRTQNEPVDFMGPMLQFDTNMILAAQMYGVKKFLYTSSIAVENPESDKYPAWAK